jgi:hypothetical protein
MHRFVPHLYSIYWLLHVSAVPYGTKIIPQTRLVATHYIPPIRFVFQVTQLSDDGRLLPKHVGASIQNKGVVGISA